MNRSPRRAMWLIALVLTIAGMIATPREGAAFKMRWEEWGPETTGDPETPGGPVVNKFPGDMVLVAFSSPLGGYVQVPVPVWLIPRSDRASAYRAVEECRK